MKIDLFSRELIILYHTLLIGASPLIPLPFLDEWVVAYLRRHMVVEIAKSHKVKLSRVEIQQLADQEGTGCFGVAGSMLVRLIKELSREIFFWLEWKRGVDLATQAYYFGYLLNAIFERGEFNPQHIVKYRLAIQNSIKGVNTKLVRNIISKTFYSSKGLVRGVTGWLFSFGKYYIKLAFRFLWRKPGQFLARFRKKKSPESQGQKSYESELNDFFEDTQPRMRDLIQTLLDSLSKGIGSLPKEHFDELNNKLILELRRESERI